MSDLQRFAASFERDGFAVVDDAFDPDLMERLDALLNDHFGHAPTYLHDESSIGDAQVEVVPWFPVRDDGVAAFDEVEDDARLRELTDAVLGAGWYSQYCMAMHSAAGSTGQPWHQDCPPERTEVFNLNRLVYTRDIDPANGGQLVVQPGSHRHGELPAGEPHEPFDGELVITPRRGTLVFVHGHCWHRVLPVHHRSRNSINYRAAPAGTPADVTDVCVYRNMRYRFSTGEVVEQRAANA